MVGLTRGEQTPMRWLGLLASVGAGALLLAALVACGAASEPRPEPVQTSSPAVESQGTDPVPSQSQARVVAEGLSSGQPSGAADGASAPMAQADTARSDGAVGQPQTAAANQVSQQTADAAVSEPAAQAEPAVADGGETPSPADAPASTTNPYADTADAAVSQQDPAAPPASNQAAPTPAPGPAPVQQEPLPDVGNQVGDRIPEFTLELAGGGTVSSVSLIEAGRPTFIFFTSTT